MEDDKPAVQRAHVCMSMYTHVWCVSVCNHRCPSVYDVSMGEYVCICVYVCMQSRPSNIHSDYGGRVFGVDCMCVCVCVCVCVCIAQ